MGLFGWFKRSNHVDNNESLDYEKISLMIETYPDLLAEVHECKLILQRLDRRNYKRGEEPSPSVPYDFNWLRNIRR